MKGADYSHWQWTLRDNVTGGRFYVPIDYSVGIRNGIEFIFQKLCDGASDTPFAQQATRDARAAGQRAAPYLWLYPVAYVSASKQAEFWYSRVKDERTIAIDAEVTSWNGSNVYPNHRDLRYVIEALRGLGYNGNIVVYTSYNYWLAHGSQDTYFAQFPLWQADPDNTPDPIPVPFERIIKQYSWKGNPANHGVNNGAACDENLFNGDENLFAEMFGGTQIPPIGENKMIVTANLKVNIRRDHYATSADDGDFLAGQSAEVLELWQTGTTKGADYEQWARIAAGWVAVWYKALGTDGKLCELTGVLNPPVGLPVINVRLEAAGYPPFAGVWTPLA